MQSQGALEEELAKACTPRPISTRTVVHRDGTSERTLHVSCPMAGETISIERCAACPMCVRLNALDGTVGRPSVACAFDAPSPPPRARQAGSLLSRFATCVRDDALDVVLATTASAAVPVVDEGLHLVGLLEPGPHVRVDDGTLGLAVEEHTLLPAAIAHMAHRRLRQVPVVGRSGKVVGVLDDLDALRALRGVDPE
jgi:CBS-domain-containing membrane protein